MLTEISFFICSTFTVILSIFMITRKQPVTAAMILVVVMMMLAGMFGLLNAQFSAVAQIIVYAGAIMVVFVFVIMLLNLPSKYLSYGRITFFELILILLGVLTTLFLATEAGKGYLSKLFLQNDNLHATLAVPAFDKLENVKNVSALMFTDYLWPFELISFLIIVAIMGAIVVAKKEKSPSHEHEHS